MLTASPLLYRIGYRMDAVFGALEPILYQQKRAEKMTKRGRKASHHVTQSGEPIVGLRRDAKSKRFFPVGKGSPSFGTDEPQAVHRFRMWQANQERQGDPLETRSFGDDLVMNEFDAETLAALNPKMLLDSPIVAGVFQQHYRQLIYSDPNRAATERDIVKCCGSGHD